MKEKLTKSQVNQLKPGPKVYEVVDTEIPGFLLRVQPSGVMTYYFSYRNQEGTRKRYSLGRHGALTTEVARKLARQKAGQVANGIDIQAEKAAERRLAEAELLHTLGGFIDAKYKPWVLAERKSGDRTIQRLEYHFTIWYGQPLSSITTWLVNKWRTDLLEKAPNRSPKGINNITGLLKAVLNKAVEWDVIAVNPLNGLKALKVDRTPKTRYLSPDEAKRLRAALDTRQDKQRRERASHNQWLLERHQEPLQELTAPFTDHLKPMVVLALNTGMRRGELFDLQWSDIDLSNRHLTVNGANAKSGHSRHIPLNDQAFQTLVTWRNQTDGKRLVFPSPVTGERLDNINSAWKTVQKLAGLQDFRFHDLRHDFASQLVSKQVDLNTVRELLGHSEIDMTLRYAHLAPEHKAAAVARLNT